MATHGCMPNSKSSGSTLLPQADRSTDEKSQAARLHPRGRRKRTTRRDLYATPAPDPLKRNLAEPRRSGSEQDLDGAEINNLHPYLGGLSLPGLHPRRLLPASSSRLVDGNPPARRACGRCSRDGPLETKPRRWSDPPHGSRGAIYRGAIYGALIRQETRRSGYRSVYGPGRLGPGQNAISESFVASLKCELLHEHRFLDRETARTAVFDYIEGFYNRRLRRHSSLGYLSPAEYERATIKEVAVA